MNGSNSYASYPAVSQIPPVDVDDALQYTPLSSVVPLSTDMLPIPISSTVAGSSLFHSDVERETSRQALEILNRHADSGLESKYLSQFIHDITSQISPAATTEYRFKSQPEFEAYTDNSNQAALEILRNAGAGTFAEMVIGRTSMSFTNQQVVAVSAPRPEATPSRTPAPARQVHATPPTHYEYGNSLPVGTPQNIRPSSFSTPANGYGQTFQVQIPISTPTQSRQLAPNQFRQTSTRSDISISPTPTPSSRIDAVVLKPSPHIDRSEYTKYERIDQRMKQTKAFAISSSSKSRKRRRSNSDDDGIIAVGVDQRAQADGSLSKLMNLLDSIFQAEDNLEGDTSGRVSGRDDTSKFWMLGSTEPCISTAIQIKLETQIKKVISVKRFARIPLEDLIRIEKLCENALRRTDAENIMPPEDPSESDFDDWVARVGSVDNGLKTAKTVLQIMVGGREEKQIYSEDLLGNVLLLVKNLIEGAFNPMIEMRSGGDQQGAFKSAFTQKKVLGGLLHEVTNILNLFSQMFSNDEATESVINSALYMAAATVFIENASNEKDSIFGIQRVEVFRMSAMDVLAKIFARYPDQRNNIIFEQILTNLEKLPVNRQQARQFKLVEGNKNIQLVSALIMRLVQTAGTYQPRRKKRGLVPDEDGVLHPEKEIVDDQDYEGRSPDEVITKLQQISTPLMDDAHKVSLAIIGYLVQKAVNTTKTGDQPYRILLDIFAEDFMSVLGYPEWPAAELLLRNLARSMCQIVDAEKSPVTAKTMALDMLGVMGSGICDLVVHLRDGRRTQGGGESSIAHLIDRYLEVDSSGNNRTEGLAALEQDLLEWDGGPFRITLEHLYEARRSDSTLQSACGYYLAVWSSKICQKWNNLSEDDDEEDIARCAANLKSMTLRKEWDDDVNIDDFTPSQIRQCYALAVLNMPFCRFFEHMFNRLLRCMDDNQAQSRSKALKSVTQLLGKDPTILNRTQVIPYIMKKAQDASSLVRDSAVDLLGKCIAIKPEIEGMVCRTIIERSADTGTSVRKRSMKILKDIYLHSKKEDLKVSIAEALVSRIKDNEPSVAEQAKKTFEEIWIAPFYSLIGDNEDEEKAPSDISPQMKLVANERVAVIIKVVQKEAMLSALHDVIKSLLQQDGNKNSSRNFRVCKTMVKSMFEDLIDHQADSERTMRANTMQTLTVFAKSDPRLFTPDQLILLQPYTVNLTTDDLHLFRSVILIYRHALVVLTERQNKFLNDVQTNLLLCLTRLPAPELPEVVSCLWTIGGILGSLRRLVAVTVSCINNIQKLAGKTIQGLEIKRQVRTLHILGLLGYYCDFEDQETPFKAQFPNWKGGLVSGLMCDTIFPFCTPSTENSIRKAAIGSLGQVCQTHAVHFLKPETQAIFDQVFMEKDKDLMKLVLSGIKGFLALEESRSEMARDDGLDPKHKKGDHPEEPGRLTQAAYANQNDGVSTSLAQKYLKEIVAIATGSQDSYALVATEVIASILRQGLVHPKELVPALVALETSSLSAINQIAYREHKTLHAKHETIVERGYMEGVKNCFKYQRDVVGDGAGASVNPYVPKLRPLYDIVKEGTNKKIRKKLLENIIKSLDFDPVKLNVDVSPTHIEYVRFVVENLAFFDYVNTEDVYLVVTQMEKLVAETGLVVTHSIETEIFRIGQEEGGKAEPRRLKVLSTGAAILSMVSIARSYIRRAFGVNDGKIRDYRNKKFKANDPTLNKAPGRNSNVSMATPFQQIEDLAKSYEDGEEMMMEQCRKFVEILNCDEFKVAGEGTDDEEADFGRTGNTPESAEDGSVAPPTPKKKRKGSADPEKPTKRRKAVPKKRK